MIGERRCWRATILLIVVFVQGSTSIRITRVKVPEYLEVGSAGDLDCSWEEDNDHMYSIKWYQAAHEFYRYTPTARDPIQIFDPPTLDVDRQKSWGGSVRIANVSLGAGGPFHCEVSADGPTFHTASDQAILNIIDLPDGGPMIRGIGTQYRMGDWVDITCISRRSKPAPQLSFMLNQQLDVASWVEPQINREDSEGLTTSTRRMRFALLPRHLHEGYARVRCKANIPGIYKESVEENISTTAPYQASVLDGGAAAGRRPEMCSTCAMVLGTLLISSLYRQVF